MQLIARGTCGLAAMLFLAIPSTALAGVTDAYPAGDYARGSTPDNCTATISEPIEVAMQGFSTPSAARNALAAETAWTDLPASNPSQLLTMQDVPGNSNTAHCRGETGGLLSPLSSDLQHRTHVRLWPNDPSGVIAGAPYRQYKTTSLCGASTGSPKWVTTPDGYNAGRDSLETAFQTNVTQGPYPLQEVDWGNSARIDQCDGTKVGSDGNVAIIQPKDSFGYNDDWVAHSANPSPNQDQNPLELAQAQGATVARYAVNWRQVGIAGSDPTDPCLQMGGNWTGLDRAYTYVTGRAICDDTPPTTATGIKPILPVVSAPDPYARWCTESDDALCGAGDCTATSDQTPGLGTNPAVASTAAANADWKGFVQNVARRYPLAKGIEIWNEPNLTRKYWGSCLPGPGRYERLLELGHDGVAASGTGTPVVMAGMSPKGEGNPDNTDWQNYLSAVFAAPQPGDPAVPTLFGAMGLHPYRSAHDGSASFADAAAGDVGLARGVLEDHGVPQKPIWVTEVGATTSGTDDGTHVEGETLQATALGSIYYRLRNMVPVVIVHRLVDPPPGRAEAAGYGAVTSPDVDPLLDQPWRRKPYYFSLCQRRGFTAAPC